MKDWIIEELETVDLSDKRLDNRFSLVLERLSDKPTASIPAACKSWTETIGAYRFFQNDAVTSEKILKPHGDATINRIREHSVVLMIQDTTELDYTGKNDIADLGSLTYENRKGLLLHATIALTPERVCLGVIDGQFLRENAETEPTPIEHHNQRPIEQKESYRWVEGYRRCAQVAAQVPDTMVVMIGDRECDIYEVFDEAAQCSHRAEWIIRSSQNRRLDGEVDQSRSATIKLWESVENAPPLGRVEFTLPKSHERKDKQVVASLQTKRLRLYPPHRKGSKLPVVEVSVIKLSEINPPNGEEPIEWIILTSLPVNTLEEAVTIIQWYVCRWQIEIYFRILKSGCTVQELQLETADRIKPAVAVYMIIAWRIFYYLMLGREYPNFPCNLVFEEEEWKSVYVIIKGKEPPPEAPQLGEMINMIASLGGYLGRKYDGPPGPKTLWLGFQRMADFALAWSMFKTRGDKICV
jgi:hypothetical protein